MIDLYRSGHWKLWDESPRLLSLVLGLSPVSREITGMFQGVELEPHNGIEM